MPNWTGDDGISLFNPRTKTMKAKYYSGIGSRETEPAILHQMQLVARRLAGQGYTLRSGGAQGADTAFYLGSYEPCAKPEIYVPWAGFSRVPASKEAVIVAPTLKNFPEALKIASQYHPAWAHLNQPVRNLMARNTYQVLGLDLRTPSAFVVFWAPNPSGPNGRISNCQGGTGQAVRLAYANNIPTICLGMPNSMELIP